MSNSVIHIPLESQSWRRQPAWARLDSLCTGVFDCPHSTPKLTDDGPLVVRSQDIRSGVFRWQEAAHVSDETYVERIARAEPRLGDILYSREGTYFGIAAEMPANKRVCLGQRMVLIRPNPEQVNFRFLRLWLNSPVLSRHLHGFRDGTVAERLNMPTIRGLSVPILPRDEQDRIAELLGSLDDKIELNRQMNETLEAMAQAIFRDWFVEFGPTRRKIDGASDPVEIMGGLVTDAERARQLADLFPARLGDNGLPEGWTKTRIDALAAQHTATIAPSSNPEEVFAHFSLPAFDAGGEPIIEAGAGILSNKTLVPPNAVLLSKLNPEIPRVWLTPSTAPHKAICSTEFLAFTAKSASSREYLYCLFKDDEIRSQLKGMVTGTSKSHQRVSPKALAAVSVTLPRTALVSHFAGIVGSLLQAALTKKAENRTLAGTRDLLLPKLISGAIRLKEADKVLEAAQ